MIGMLWFDNNPSHNLEMKVITAATYFQAKYNTIPQVCQVNKSELDKEIVIQGIAVQPVNHILKNHLLIGTLS